MKNRSRLVVILIILTAVIVVTAIAMLSVKTQPKKDVSGTKTATFAGGCFWCVEADFEKVPGVIEAVSGYTGGEEVDPDYKQVSSGMTGHRESVQVFYDEKEVSYRQLVQYFFQHVDPTDTGGSFGDRGEQYTSAIFYEIAEEKKIAQEEKSLLQKSNIFEEEVATEILPVGKFYDAEDYHQNYYSKNPLRYRYYRGGSGRDQFLEEIWRKDTTEIRSYLSAVKGFDLRELTPLQYDVTQKEVTEAPFENEYWEEKRAGIYVDRISGQPLFSSKDKYDSGTGWPSFTKPIEENILLEREEKGLFTTKVELRGSMAKSHLGHVFSDGPAPGGKRYCINSAALMFVPKEELVGGESARFLKLF